jgi:cell wall assembly regulator SMI1
VDEATVRGRLAELELEPPSELIELYGLHDGTDDPWAFLVDDGVRFARSDSAAGACSQLRSSAAQIAAAPWWELSPSDLWRPEWFPVFPLTRSDENVVIGCKRGAPDFGRLMVVRWEATEARPVADSVAQFLDAVADRFETGRSGGSFP